MEHETGLHPSRQLACLCPMYRLASRWCEMKRAQHDVVIVGGGPVGLWLACELKLAGIDVVVLERRTKRMNQSRALTVHGRSLEVFALRGIADRFLANGEQLKTAHF